MYELNVEKLYPDHWDASTRWLVSNAIAVLQSVLILDFVWQCFRALFLVVLGFEMFDILKYIVCCTCCREERVILFTVKI